MYCGGERRWRKETYKEKMYGRVEEEEEALLLSLIEAQ